jgi:phosphohistidine phosphatase
LRIFLIRHGDADADIPDGLGDEARALTAKARVNIDHHFASLAERFGSVGLVLTSPLVRTVQTAQILSHVLKYEGPLRAHRCLLPDMPVGALEPVLTEHADQDLVLVGHQPSMGAMASHLMGLQTFPKIVTPGTVIALQKDITPENTPARLLFFASPGQPVHDSI